MAPTISHSILANNRYSPNQLSQNHHDSRSFSKARIVVDQMDLSFSSFLSSSSTWGRPTYHVTRQYARNFDGFHHHHQQQQPLPTTITPLSCHKQLVTLPENILLDRNMFIPGSQPTQFWDPLDEDDPNEVPPLMTHGSMTATTTTATATATFSTITSGITPSNHPHLLQPQPYSKKSTSFVPKTTGTTIAGCTTADGYVVLGADTRATESTMIADKKCEKIHPLASNLWCCGAGTSADLDHITRQTLYALTFHRGLYTTANDDEYHYHHHHHHHEKKNDNVDMNGGRTTSRGTVGNAPGRTRFCADSVGSHHPAGILHIAVPVSMACQFLQNYIFDHPGMGVNLIVGGVWKSKPYLRAIHPHGSIDVNLPYTALGSGGLAAMSVLEQRYTPHLTVRDGIQLIQDAILSGIQNDLGSGSQVDICIIDPNGISHYRRGMVPEETLPPMSSVPHVQDQNGTTDHHPHQVPQDQDRDDQGRNIETAPVTGVNGFGNLPFTIVSRRSWLISDRQVQNKIAQQWNEHLGIPSTS